MSGNPILGWLRLAAGSVLALGLSAAVMVPWWAPAWPPVMDAADLAADPGAGVGNEVVVTGEWESVGPLGTGYMVVVLRGRDGTRVLCYFEDVPAAHRTELETRLIRVGWMAIHGRRGGAENGIAVLQCCSLLD